MGRPESGIEASARKARRPSAARMQAILEFTKGHTRSTQLEANAQHVEVANIAATVDDAGSLAKDASFLCVALGEPRFIDAKLAALCASTDAATAWLQAHRDHGQGAMQHVRGRFAVAIFEVDRGRAWLAVDRFGSIPLCYSVSDGRLAVSDRADRVPVRAATIRTQALFDFLFFHAIPAPATVFDAIHRVPAGHVVAVVDGTAAISRYWTPRFSEPHNGDFNDLKHEFLELVRSSVAREADGAAVGAFLSGGTDSSTVAGMLASVTGKPARTYSIGFDASGYDEMHYARVASKHFGTDHHEYYVTPQDVVDGIAAVAAHFDQPFGNSSALPSWLCARNARADGVSRLLAGDGGDELFGGNSRYAKQRVFSWYDRSPQSLRSQVIEPLVPRLQRIPVLRKGASYVEQARVPLPERLHMYNLLVRLGYDTVFTPAFLATIDDAHPMRCARYTWDRLQEGSLINRMLAFDWKFTLADNDLPKVVGAAQLAGIDVAFPLLADELVDFSTRLPPAWKLKGLQLRWFFKEALRGFLPEEIISKKKHGFGLPFGVWAVEHQDLNALVHDSLRAFSVRGVIRPEFIDRLLHELLPSHPGYYGEMAWVIIMLEYWLHEHEIKQLL